MLYILDGHKPKHVDDTVAWAMWFETADLTVAYDVVGDVDVDTAFLGVDHLNIRKGDPLLFETIVYGGELNHCTQRYATWDEALAGHEEILRRVKYPPLRLIRKQQDKPFSDNGQ